jgi:hypothetical protein
MSHYNLDWRGEVTPMLEKLKADYMEGRREWARTNSRVAWYFLEVVPLASPQAHDPVYLCFRRVDETADTAEARYCTLAEIQSEGSVE